MSGTAEDCLSVQKERLAAIFGEVGAVQYGDYTWRSGKKSHYKIDAEKIFATQTGSELVGALGRRLLAGLEDITKKRYNIAGVRRGGTMFARAVADGRPYLDVDYKSGSMDGSREDGPYAIFEDVASTGYSIIKTKELMEDNGLEAQAAIVIVINDPHALDNIINSKLKARWIFHRLDLGVKDNGA